MKLWMDGCASDGDFQNRGNGLKVAFEEDCGPVEQGWLVDGRRVEGNREKGKN